MRPKAKARIDWVEAAGKLAASLPRMRLHPRVVEAADAWPRRGTWGIGFSGGPDSLALLLLVWSHWPDRRRNLRALHFDHRLRGAESRADAAFCRRVCTALKVKYVAGVWAGRHRGASEAEARAARMAFFARKARVVWLGHQQDDVAETMLMRLARGSGTGGLAAPRPVQPVAGARLHLRPLLNLGKDEILRALRSAGVSWRTDSSNIQRDFFRNRIRRDVIPAWIASAQRDALAGAAYSRTLLEEDDSALDAWLEELPVRAPRNGLALPVLAGKPRGLQRRALHRWLREIFPEYKLSRQAFEHLLGAVQRGRPTRHSLGREGFGVIRGGVLRFERTGKARRRFSRQAN